MLEKYFIYFFFLKKQESNVFHLFFVVVVAKHIFYYFRYEPGRRKPGFECRYNQNKGYVVFSAMGSFFIPMSVMLYVYTRICCVLTSRHNSMARTEVKPNKKYYVFFSSIFYKIL